MLCCDNGNPQIKGGIHIGKTSAAVKARYRAKTYQQYSISLRKREDEELINAIEEEKDNGGSPVSFLRKLFYGKED